MTLYVYPVDIDGDHVHQKMGVTRDLDKAKEAVPRVYHHRIIGVDLSKVWSFIKMALR